jgi:hypothetical protein
VQTIDTDPSRLPDHPLLQLRGGEQKQYCWQPGPSVVVPAGVPSFWRNNSNRDDLHMDLDPLWMKQAWGDERDGDAPVLEWYGFFLPGKAKPDIVQKTYAAIRQVMGQKDIIDGLAQIGLEAQVSASTDAFAKELRMNHDQWSDYIKRVGFTADS